MRSSVFITAVLVLGCGKSDSKAAPGNKPAGPTAAAIDACTLVTRDDVMAATGRQDFGQPKSTDGGTRCRYASSRGSVTVYSQPAPRKQWDELKATLVREGKNIADAPGIGDAAYYWDERLYVHRRDREVTINISARMNPTTEDAARDRASALAMARVALDRF